MEVPPAHPSKKPVQRIFPDSKWANQEPTILDREVDGRPRLHLGLGGEGTRNPQSEAVPPFLNLRLHAVSSGYTLSTPCWEGSSRARQRRDARNSAIAIMADRTSVRIRPWGAILPCPGRRRSASGPLRLALLHERAGALHAILRRAQERGEVVLQAEAVGQRQRQPAHHRLLRVAQRDRRLL